jgi:hypothetical protein
MPLSTVKYQTAETLTKQKHCCKIATHVLQPCIIGKLLQELVNGTKQMVPGTVKPALVTTSIRQ